MDRRYRASMVVGLPKMDGRKLELCCWWKGKSPTADRVFSVDEIGLGRRSTRPRISAGLKNVDPK